jgi:hypothetical protein
MIEGVRKQYVLMPLAEKDIGDIWDYRRLPALASSEKMRPRDGIGFCWFTRI